jgi:hypothetical protein
MNETPETLLAAVCPACGSAEIGEIKSHHMLQCRNGISSHELARAIGVTQKSAWRWNV